VNYSLNKIVIHNRWSVYRRKHRRVHVIEGLCRPAIAGAADTRKSARSRPPVDRIAFALAYGDHEDDQLGAADLVDQPVSQALQLDFVAISLARESRAQSPRLDLIECDSYSKIVMPTFRRSA
jgi:hypothetical protein